MAGCSRKQIPKKPKCIIHPTSKDGNRTVIEEDITLSQEESEIRVIDDGEGGSNKVEDEYCIVDVFTDSIFLNGDRIKLIQNLDASKEERAILLKAYKNHTDLWSRTQREKFSTILEEDKYLSLCGARRYYDNLLFTTEEPQLDILYSIIFLKYINNLKNGCYEWVAQRREKQTLSHNVHGNYLLDMIEKDALIERLFIPYLPKEKSFLISVREYKKMVDKGSDKEGLREKRLEVEEKKRIEKYPSYRK